MIDGLILWLAKMQIGGRKNEGSGETSGISIPTQKMSFPGLLPEFHELLQSWDSSFPSSLQLTFWGAFNSACCGNTFPTRVKWGDEEGRRRRETDVGWRHRAGRGSKGAAAPGGSRTVEAVTGPAGRPAEAPALSPSQGLLLIPITAAARRPRPGRLLPAAFSFSPSLTHQPCFSVNL